MANGGKIIDRNSENRRLLIPETMLGYHGKPNDLFGNSCCPRRLLGLLLIQPPKRRCRVAALKEIVCPVVHAAISTRTAEKGSLVTPGGAQCSGGVDRLTVQ